MLRGGEEGNGKRTRSHFFSSLSAIDAGASAVILGKGMAILTRLKRSLWGPLSVEESVWR